MCQLGLQSSQGTTWGEFASRLTHVNLKGHVGLSKGLPHDMALGFPQSERWMSDPEGEATPKTEATVFL